MSAVTPDQPLASQPRLSPTGNVRRRKAISRAMETLAFVASFATVALLATVVGSVLIKALPALNLDFFTKNQALFGEPGGGIANAFVGTIVIVLIAGAMALPFGVLIAIYVTEFARPRVAVVIRSALDVLNGIPSIVIGIFVYSLLVLRFKQSAFMASIALAIIGLPLISRSAQEVLKLVPQTLREASQGLGVSKWRTVLFVVLPTTMGGILTGATLAIARMAGETAPILFTTSLFFNLTSADPGTPLATVPFKIFDYSQQPDPHLQDQAWAAAFVLIMFVLVISLSARYFLYRSQRKLTGAGRPPSLLSQVLARTRRT
jgi:phosphate transport system permease protein